MFGYKQFGTVRYYLLNRVMFEKKGQNLIV